MRKLILSLLLLPLLTGAQKVTTSDDVRVINSVGFNETLYANENESFFRISWLPNPFFTIKPLKNGANLITKFDKDLKVLYTADLDSKLKEGTIYQVLPLKSKLWVIYHYYRKKENTLEVFARQMNKETGDLETDTKTLGNIICLKEPEPYQIIFSPDSSNLLIVSKTRSDDKNTSVMQIIICDGDFNKKSERLISVPVPLDSYKPFTAAVSNDEQNVVLIGKVFGKKKKVTYLDYVLCSSLDQNKNTKHEKFTMAEKMLAEKSLVKAWLPDNKFLLTTFYQKVVYDWGYYSDNYGFYMGEFDLKKGSFNFTKSTPAPLELAKILAPDFRKNMPDEEPYIPKRHTLTNLLTLKDNSHLLISECDWIFERYVSSVSNNYSRTISGFSSAEIMIFKFDADANLQWTRRIHKYQGETYTTAAGFSEGGLPQVGPHMRLDRFPMYSGYLLETQNDLLRFYYNDNPKNLKYIDSGPIQETSDFTNTQVVCVELNIQSGEMQKKLFFPRISDITVMPRFSDIYAGYVFMPATKIRAHGLAKMSLQMFKIKL